MKKALTVRQMTAMYNSVKYMGDGGVSVKGMAMLDLAMNKAIVEPRIIEFEKKSKIPERIREYNRKIVLCKNDEERQKLITDFEKDLLKYEETQAEVEGMIDETRDVEIIMIKKTDLVIDEKNGKAAEILYGLLPCLE